MSIRLKEKHNNAQKQHTSCKVPSSLHFWHLSSSASLVRFNLLSTISLEVRNNVIDFIHLRFVLATKFNLLMIKKWKKKRCVITYLIVELFGIFISSSGGVDSGVVCSRHTSVSESFSLIFCSIVGGSTNPSLILRSSPPSLWKNKRFG